MRNNNILAVVISWLAVLVLTAVTFGPSIVLNISTLRMICSVSDACLPMFFQGNFFTTENQKFPELASACQALIASRMAETLESALNLFEQGQPCPRQELVIARGGELAWQQSDLQKAGGWWRRLPAEQRLSWAYNLVLGGQQEQARFLAGQVLEEIDAGETVELPVDQLSQLAHVLRLAGDWQTANSLYQNIHERLPEDLETIFFLGMSYRQVGKSPEAVEVLNVGLPMLSEQQAPYAGDYYVQLGLAYRETGNYQQALNVLLAAESWMKSQRTYTPSGAEFVQTLIEQVKPLVSPEE